LIELDDKQGQDKWFNLEYIENKHELSKKMEVSASASYLGFFSVKSKFVNEQNFKRESVYLLVSVLVTNCRAEFKEYKPSEDFTKFIAKDPINWNTFLKKYGNEFIFSIATGGEFYALYEFHFESIQDKKELEVQIKSSGWGFKAGGEFKNALDKIDTNVNITCNLYIRGGKGKLPEPKGDKIIEAALQFPEAVDLKYGAPIDYKAETKDYYVVENFPGFPDDIDENLDNNEKICDNISEELAKIEVLEQSDFDPSNKKKLVEIKDHLIAEIQKIASNPISRHQEPTHIFDEVKEIESEEMWTLVPGKLTQVSVGSCEYVWGVNHKNEIRRWNNNEKKWEDKPSKVQSVSVGADGTTWAKGLNKKSYRWDINRWINCGGAFEQISVGSKDQVWGIDTKGVVCQWKNEKWGKKEEKNNI